LIQLKATGVDNSSTSWCLIVYLSYFITDLTVTLMIFKHHELLVKEKKNLSRIITLKLSYSLMNQTQMVNEGGKNKWQISLVNILEYF